VFVVLAHDGEPERAFINPRLVLSRPSNLYDEGCLSLPDIRGEIMRPPHAVITAMDIDGNEFTLESDGLFARVWQHEYDHLDGILIIDRMRPIDRLVNRRAIRDLERAAPRAGH
jgi:peptide deformylase